MTTPRKRLFLHCGTEKTGSTAIQVFCTMHRELLRSRDIHYPTTGLGATFTYGHHELALFPKKRDQRHAAEQLWENAVQEMTSQECDTVLLSSEEFWSWTEADDLLWLHNRLRDFNVMLMIYFREQAEYILSSYCTNVIFFGEDRAFSAFAEEVDKVYLRRLQVWKEVFGQDNITVRPYEINQLHHCDVVLDFFHTLKFDAIVDDILRDGLLSRRQLLNPTPPIDVIRLFYALNRLKKRDLTAQLRDVWRLVRTGSPERYTFFSQVEQREIMRYCADSNAEIARRYLGRVDGKLFKEQSIIPVETIELTLTTPPELVALFLLQTFASPEPDSRSAP